MFKKFIALSCLSSTIALTNLAAGANFRPEMPTLSAGGRGYFLTSKSGLAGSNDTGLMYDYHLSVFAGDSKSVSVHLNGSSSQVDYELNSSSITSSELNFLVRAYLDFVYVGAFGGTYQMNALRADSTVIDAIASQYGGNIGLLLGLMKNTSFGIDTLVSIPTEVKEANQLDLVLGLRTETRVFMSFDLTRRLLDLDAGFLYATQEATLAGEGQGETSSAPYIGFSVNTDF